MNTASPLTSRVATPPSLNGFSILTSVMSKSWPSGIVRVSSTVCVSGASTLRRKNVGSPSGATTSGTVFCSVGAAVTGAVGLGVSSSTGATSAMRSSTARSAASCIAGSTTANHARVAAASRATTVRTLPITAPGTVGGCTSESVADAGSIPCCCASTPNSSRRVERRNTPRLAFTLRRTSDAPPGAMPTAGGSKVPSTRPLVSCSNSRQLASPLPWFSTMNS